MMMGEVVVVHQIATQHVALLQYTPAPVGKQGYTNGTVINSINTSCTAGTSSKEGTPYRLTTPDVNKMLSSFYFIYKII